MRPTASASRRPRTDLCGGLDRFGTEAFDLGREGARRRPDEAGDERAARFREPDHRDLGAGAVNRGFGDLGEDRIERRTLGEGTACP